MRAKLEDTFMALAAEWARRSTCSSRAAVGCVLVNADSHVVASGYNGSPRGLPHCDDVGCLMEGGHCVRALHAEINSILQCARTEVSSVGTTLYVTHRPCVRCARILAQAGVEMVVYASAYDSDELGLEVMRFFADAKIAVARYSPTIRLGGNNR